MEQPSSSLDRARLARLVAEHHARYGAEPALVARAPGRINLIGEHTDYNDGFVFPAAIDRDVLLVATPRGDRRLRLHSLNQAPPADLDLAGLRPATAAHAWYDYPAGVAWALQEAGQALRGLDATLDGTVPLGGGLSSSAALEVATALALLAASEADVPPRDLALLCRRAENEYVGANTGIMDQFISLFGRADHALFLDCRSLETELVRLEAPDLLFAVCDSGVRHGHAGGEYNRRRRECAAAVEILAGALPGLDSLRDVTPEQLEGARSLFAGAEDEVFYRRAHHVVTENARVPATVAAIAAHDWTRVGELIDASHASLRDDYEVSVPEIDALVAIAHRVAGVLGARLMGGGFGGSTLTRLRREALSDFAARVEAEYPAVSGHPATVHAVTIVDGAWARPLDEVLGGR